MPGVEKPWPRSGTAVRHIEQRIVGVVRWSYATTTRRGTPYVRVGVSWENGHVWATGAHKLEAVSGTTTSP